MLKKRSLLIKMSSYLLTLAPLMVLNGTSNLLVGEPNLPKKYIKNKY